MRSPQFNWERAKQLGFALTLPDGVRSRSVLEGPLLRGSQDLRGRQVFGSIDADGVLRHLHQIEGITMLQGSQLLQRLRQLQGRRLEAHELKQKLPTVDIDTDVFVIAVTHAGRVPVGIQVQRVSTSVGNGKTREIKRASASRPHDLYDVWIYNIPLVLQGDDGGRNRQFLALDRELNQLGDRGRREKRHVALQVQDEILAQLFGDLGDPIGTGAVIRGSHPGLSPAGLHHPLYFLAVGGDDDAAHSGTGLRALDDTHDHWHAVYQAERLARQSDRLHPGGNDGRDFHADFRKRLPEGSELSLIHNFTTTVRYGNAFHPRGAKGN